MSHLNLKQMRELFPSRLAGKSAELFVAHSEEAWRGQNSQLWTDFALPTIGQLLWASGVEVKRLIVNSPATTGDGESFHHECVVIHPETDKAVLVDGAWIGAVATNAMRVNPQDLIMVSTPAEASELLRANGVPPEMHFPWRPDQANADVNYRYDAITHVEAEEYALVKATHQKEPNHF